MTRRAPLLALAVVAAASCRAAPIPIEQRYPAGSPFPAVYRTIADTRIRLVDSGSGTAVVFLHGFGASLYGWRHTLPAVSAAGYRVIALDSPGFGESTPPARGYHNAEYARLVIALLDSLRVSSAVLVGHSMGGAIAAEVALTRPDRVRGLVLIDAAGFGVLWPGILKAARWPIVGTAATALRGRWITARMLRSLYADASKVSETDIDQYYAPVPSADFARALRGVLREFRFDSLSGRLGALETPTLVLWGDADRLIPLRDGARLARELPRGAFVVIPRAGHTPAEETPDELNRLLIDFLKDGLSRIPENVAWSTSSSQPWHSSSP